MDKNLLAAMALLLGALAAFFFVFRTLLTDGPQGMLAMEYAVAYALIVAAYATLSFGLGRWGQLGARSGVLLALPGTIIVAVYNDALVPLRALLLLAIAVGTLLGLWAAWRGSASTSQAAS